ncbi:hypothetical protein QF204_13700, partial [Proteus faecis]
VLSSLFLMGIKLLNKVYRVLVIKGGHTMYDDISNLKDKFQEDAFAFQDFSSSTTQHVDNKIELKQPVISSPIPSYHQDALAVKAKKDNLIKSKEKLLSDNKIFDSKETDRVYAHENISLKEIFSFIASV